jgi:hypothetical protein
VITCEEFTKVFINMGFEEREKELKAYRKMQKEVEEHRKQIEIEKQAAKDNWNATKVAYNFTDEEWESAMFKLKEAAWRYFISANMFKISICLIYHTIQYRFDRTMPGSPSLEAFEQQSMPAHELKDQLKKVFLMKVSMCIINFFL